MKKLNIDFYFSTPIFFVRYFLRFFFIIFVIFQLQTNTASIGKIHFHLFPNIETRASRCLLLRDGSEIKIKEVKKNIIWHLKSLKRQRDTQLFIHNKNSFHFSYVYFVIDFLFICLNDFVLIKVRFFSFFQLALGSVDCVQDIYIYLFKRKITELKKNVKNFKL